MLWLEAGSLQARSSSVCRFLLLVANRLIFYPLARNALCVCLRPPAGCCGLCRLDVTHNDTRRGGPPEILFRGLPNPSANMSAAVTGTTSRLFLSRVSMHRAPRYVAGQPHDCYRSTRNSRSPTAVRASRFANCVTSSLNLIPVPVRLSVVQRAVDSLSFPQFRIVASRQQRVNRAGPARRVRRGDICTFEEQWRSCSQQR